MARFYTLSGEKAKKIGSHTAQGAHERRFLRDDIILLISLILLNRKDEFSRDIAHTTREVILIVLGAQLPEERIEGAARGVRFFNGEGADALEVVIAGAQENIHVGLGEVSIAATRVGAGCFCHDGVLSM